MKVELRKSLPALEHVRMPYLDETGMLPEASK